ncbi:AAA family ATPase [candidate division WOR-3 bacterium]|uniref:AAA family ATPase n=1 Tax=candidate division WOR-3 bacterium TaxID=2052148 RepID=A0A660SIR2_UNCW3|nr:MAG: AAA family ATPase [candidate division WOR-3 bacterium]
MDYETFYSLNEHPFGFTTDEKYYYDAPQHSKALIKLLHAVENHAGLAILIGEVGAGKTTLSRKMLDELMTRDYEATLLVIIHSEITPDWFLRKLALMFDLEPEEKDKVAIISGLYQRLVELNNKAKGIAILIDEANMLKTKEIMEEMRGLLNLEANNRKLINFILFGLPEMEENLNLDPPLAQRIAVRCFLEPLDKEATVGYIKHRLRIAGAKRELFTSDSFDKIYQFSRGIPRLINSICDNALLEGFLRKKESIDKDIIVEVARDLGLLKDAG